MQSNKRRVTRHISQIEPLGVQKGSQAEVFLLCSDSMYGSCLMDGKMKILKLSAEQPSEESKSVNPSMEELHYVETTFGVSVTQLFQFQPDQPQMA